jgi:hypothetical protein
MRKNDKPASRRIPRPPAPPARPVSRPAPPRAAVKTAPLPPFEPVSTPLPIRITSEQQRLLAAKRERTGVPIQELVRRAIDHMLTTVKESEVPSRREPAGSERRSA